MADGLGDIFVGLDDFRKFSADSFLQNANRLIGDVWTQHTIDNIPQMAGDIWTQHVTNQLPNLTSMLAPPAVPQTASAAPPDPFAPITSSSTTPTIPTAPAPSAGADSGTPPPAPPPALAAGVPGPVTETTAGLSGGGQGTGNMTDRAQGILAGGAQAASWLGDQGQKALQAVLVTEGGLNNARGDQGKSAGPLQFYEGGQLANLAQQLGMSLEQAKGWVEQNPVDAIKWAIGTPDKPGYLGGAIQRGLQAGLQGADLATYAQRHGQVSVSPERAGQNFQALFGTGQEVLGGAGQAVQSVASTVGGALQGVAPAAADKVAALADQAGATGQSWVDMAKSFLGKPYIWGSGSGAGGRGTQDIDPSTGLPRGFDCLVAGTLVETIRGAIPIERIMPGDFVLTRNGYRPVLGAWLAGMRDVWRVGLSNGSELIGTATHRILTPDGYKPLSTLLNTDTLLTCYRRQSSSTDCATTATRNHLVHRFGITSSVPADHFIGLSMNMLSGRSRSHGKFTTETTTPSTTTYRTWRPFQGPGIEPNQPMRGVIACEPVAFVGSRSSRSLVRGTDPNVGTVLAVAKRRHAERMDWILARWSARNAEPESGLSIGGDNGSVAIDAPDWSLHVIGGPQKVGRAQTFDLEVQGEHEFFANGALVANCSGFVSYILQNGLGIDLPAQTAAAYGSGKLDQIDSSQAQPGDVVFYNMNSGDPHMQHMALYMGNGKIIEAGGVESDVNVADANAVGPPTFMRPKGGVPREATNALSAVGSVAQPSPSVFGQTFKGANQPAQSPQSAPPPQSPKSIWDQLGGGISDVFKNVFGGGGSSSTPPPPPEGGGYGAVPPGGQNPLPDVFASVGQAAQTGLSNVTAMHGAANAVSLPPASFTTEPLAPGQQPEPTSTQLLNTVRSQNFPSILEPNHPLNVLDELSQKYASSADPFNLRIRDRMPPEDQAKWDSLATQVGGVEMPTLPGGDLAPKAGNINLAEVPGGINPFALHAEPGPNRVPLTVDEAVSHLQDLEAQYTRNDATIQTLENRLSGPTTGRGSFTGTVVRPPWGVGWTNDALAAAAQQHGVSPYQDLWWEQAGLNTGSAEVKRLSESGLKGTGSVQQTPTQMRADLNRLYSEQEQIMQATEHATANGDRTLYRPLAPVSELPFAEYTPPETNAVQPDVPAAIQVPSRTSAPGGGTTAPASSGSVGTAASTTGEPAAAAAVASAGGGGTVPPIRPPSPPMSGGASPIPPRGPNFDPSRAFDYDKLAQMRQDFESRQPQLDLNAPPKPNTVDKVISYTVNNMLSGVGTQIQNIMGNLSATVSRPLVTAGGGLTGDAGLFVDAARDVAAMGATFSEAFSRAGQTLRTGVRSGQPEQFATSAFAPQLRLLSAGDEFFRTLNAAGGQAAEVSRLLRENPSLSFEETLAKYQGRILAAGEDAAARSVYEKGGIGWGESIAQARSQLLHSDDPAKKTLGVILNAVVPFSKVPDTILTLGVRGLPGVNEAYGIGKTVSLLRQGEVYAARREAGATALLTAANLGILAQALQGNITGDGPDDPTLLSQMMAARDQNGNALWRPHSVKLPDGRWIDYGFLGPMEIHMAAIANVVEGAREQGGSINPQPAQMAVNRLTKTIGNLWYLRGLSDVLSAINGGQLATPNVANSIEAIGDRFVWQGSLLNEIRQLTDPTVRDPQNPLAREANRIPGIEALVPARSDPTTGQPLQRPQDVLSIMSRGSPPGMSPGSGSAEILSRSDVAVSPAPKQITVGKFPIQLTHDEQQQYTQLRGQLIDQMVAPLARDNAFQTAPLYVREQVLRKMLDQASSAANKMLIGQLEPNSLNQRLQQSQQTITTNTPFLPEDTSAAGRVPALAR